MTNEELEKLRADLADLDARRAHDHDDPVRLANPLVAMFDEATVRKLLAALDEATKRAEAARRMLDRMAEESHTFNAILENTQRDLDEARAQLAALHAAAQRFRDAVSDDGLTCRDNGLDSAAAVEEEWEAIDRVLADAAPTAAKHKRRVRAKVIAEVLGLYDGTNGCAAADLTPVIEAAQSLETRIRADERVRALREARERIERHDAAAYTAQGGCMEYWREGRESAAETLRAMADEAERGTR